MFGRANPSEKPVRGTQEYDRLVIQAFGDVLASGKHATDAFHDVLALPYPKEDILTALEDEMLRETSNERLASLRAGSIFLVQYQDGVGYEPVTLNSDVHRAQVFAKRSELEIVLIKARTEAVLALKAARETYRAELVRT
jgi:hypothetical protein